MSANGRDRGYILAQIVDAAIRERLDLDLIAGTKQRSAAIRADYEAKLRAAGLWGAPENHHQKARRPGAVTPDRLYTHPYLEYESMLSITLPPKPGGFNPTDTRIAAACRSWQAPHPRALRHGEQHADQVHQGQHRRPGGAAEGRDLRVVLGQAGLGRADPGQRPEVVVRAVPGRRRQEPAPHHRRPAHRADHAWPSSGRRELLAHAKLGRDLLAEEQARPAPSGAATPRSRSARW